MPENEAKATETPVTPPSKATSKKKVVRRKRALTAKEVVKATSAKKHRGWPKGKKRGPRKVKKQRYWSRRPKAQQPTPESVTAPSGAKLVGVEVIKTDGSRLHAPIGSTWKWTAVGSSYNLYNYTSTSGAPTSMLEINGPDGKLFAHIPAQYVAQVAADIWTSPLWSVR